MKQYSSAETFRRSASRFADALGKTCARIECAAEAQIEPAARDAGQKRAF